MVSPAAGEQTPHRQVTARKWRPQVFDDIVGQPHVAVTLRNAIASRRIPHAYLFSGPRGVGKTTAARILSRAVNCPTPKGSDPCNACDICLEILEGRSMNVFEIDGASNRGVDEIRNLRESVRYGPSRGTTKVYIIDEVHMLTKEAFNALLKTLEEPPPYVLFVFATTELHKVPPTIVSRCQRFAFHRITSDEIRSAIALIARKEKISIDDEALALLAQRADGSLRDAQSLFDQLDAYAAGKITGGVFNEMLHVVPADLYFRVSAAIAAHAVPEAFAIADEIVSAGHDPKEFVAGLAGHFRNLLVAASTKETGLIEGPTEMRARYAQSAAGLGEDDLLRMIRICTETEAALRWTQQPRFRLELALVSLVKMESSVSIRALLDEIEALKKKDEGLRPGPDARAPQAEVRTPRPEPRAPQQEVRAPQRASLPAMPVAGSVKASQPSLRPEQVVPAGEIPNWAAMIEEARRERMMLGTVLSETRLLSSSGNNINLACPDDFHITQLQRNREYLSELAERVLGAKVRFEGILAASSASVAGRVAPGQQGGAGSAPAGGRGGAIEAGGTGRAAGTSSATSTSADGSSNGNSGGGTGGRDELRAHPVVQALMREFGAEEID